jgi:hypothetical protein
VDDVDEGEREGVIITSDEGEEVGRHDRGSKKEEEKTLKCEDFVFVETHITY